MNTSDNASPPAESATKDPGFDLDWPGTLIFSSQLALKGHHLNKFALSLRRPENRSSYLADEAAYMKAQHLSEAEIRLVLERDWSALLLAGGHLQAVLKVAATVGQSLWHIGAHNAQMDVERLKAACPRKVSGLPEGMH
ncbi:hypothetical protein [Pusillimonas noertemannii]|uniref:hypothetical protein n=1 Tax=Pusillimonas noertemannii TaxID=305977 RepID=UPI00031854CC|nr:hypothetical protein [Pusillimonas noertemannii]